MADKEIRTIMAPLTVGHLLLPNTTVAEIMAFVRPTPFKDAAPAWLLGELAWEGWQVPVICYEKLLNKKSGNAITPKARILIVKTLGESTQLNYIGLLIQGLPKLKKVTADSLVEIQTDGLPDTLFSKVSIDDVEAMIPDIGDLTLIVEQAAYDV